MHIFGILAVLPIGFDIGISPVLPADTVALLREKYDKVSIFLLNST